jgi:preprotein translocase subunit SecF
MEFFPRKTHIAFMSHRRFAAAFSVMLFVASLMGIALFGLNWGLDFTGGTQLELQYPPQITADLEKIRQHLDAHHIQSKVSYFGSTHDVVLRITRGTNNPAQEEERAVAIFAGLQLEEPELKLQRMDVVGSEVGDTLVEQGTIAVIAAILVSMLYIIFRFERRLAFGAAIALLHDPVVIMGFFAYTQMECDVGTLAAILAVIGYSLNDTIVVCDRVRENFRAFVGLKGAQKKHLHTPASLLDLSINQTLSRTLMTSFLTLLVVLSLLIFGGSSLRGFSTAFVIGIIIGTYSSIYVASSTALFLGLTLDDLLAKKWTVSEAEHP